MHLYDIFTLGFILLISYTGGAMVKDYIQMKYYHVKVHKII